MRKTDAGKYVGEVVMLDLVSGQQVVAKVEEVTEDGYIITDKIIHFVGQPTPQDPSKPASESNPMVMQVHHIPYGAPFISEVSGKPISLDHIIMAHDVTKQLRDAYYRLTTSIEIANVGSLKDIRPANQ